MCRRLRFSRENLSFLEEGENIFPMMVSFPRKATSHIPVNVGDNPMCMGTAPAFISCAKGSQTI